jgi:S-adenosyl-L-methionine methyltransferase
MSRLDSFIRRVSAQRDVLDHVCTLLPPGPVLELGLGNGRTFHHLREKLPGRRILAFDRTLGAHESSVPPPDDLVLGEIRETAARFAGIGAALVHADIETNYAETDADTARWLPPLAVSLLAAGGIVASGLALLHPDLVALALPEGVPRERYFLYRHIGSADVLVRS